MGFGTFDRPSQIQPVGFEDQTRFRNHHPTDSIAFSHIEYDFFVSYNILMEGQVVTVGIHVFRIERLNLDVGPQVPSDFCAGKNHDTGFRGFVCSSRFDPLWQ